MSCLVYGSVSVFKSYYHKYEAPYSNYDCWVPLSYEYSYICICIPNEANDAYDLYLAHDKNIEMLTCSPRLSI